ncbi:MAG: hypothetical protein V5B31_07235 [Candidatus Accumulibacter propinquus]|jgi:hypothetical protein|uniref:hypothetical protein n=1 Tax=Candidatus Accumulibacter propinquus TaxID=2954380 RepID=UPI002FC38E55
MRFRQRLEQIKALVNKSNVFISMWRTSFQKWHSEPLVAANVVIPLRIAGEMGKSLFMHQRNFEAAEDFSVATTETFVNRLTADKF